MPAPKLLLPINTDTLITYAVDFQWENLEETYDELAYFYEYWLEIAEDADFTDPTGVISAVESFGNNKTVIEEILAVANKFDINSNKGKWGAADTVLFYAAQDKNLDLVVP